MSPKNEPENRNKKLLLFLGSLAFLGAVLFFSLRKSPELQSALTKIVPRASQVLPEADLVPAETQFIPEEGGALDAEPKRAGGGGRSGEPAERYFCRLVDEGIYLLPEEFIPLLLVGDTTKIVVTDDESRCLRTGLALSLAFVKQDRGSRIPFLHRVSVKAEVKRIRDFVSVSDLQLQSYNPKAYGFKSMFEHTNAMSLAYGPEFTVSPVREIEFSFTTKDISKGAYGAPEIHPLAKSLRRNDLDASQPIFIDLRAAAQFRAGSLPGAINLPLEAPALQSRPKDFEAVKRLGLLEAKKVKDLLPADRMLVPVAENELVATAYNFINYLHQLGFRNIGYFRGGVEAYQGKMNNTPNELRGVTTVNFEQVQRMLAAGVKPIDTRAMRKFTRGSLPNAQVATYLEVRKDPMRAAEMSAEGILKSGDRFKLPALQKGSAALIYGTNDHDWGAMKAAAIARDAGLSVSWYRKGFDDWAFHREFLPETKVQNNFTRENWEKSVRELGLDPNAASALSPPGMAKGQEKRVVRPPTKDETYLYQVPVNEPQRTVAPN